MLRGFSKTGQILLLPMQHPKCATVDALWEQRQVSSDGLSIYLESKTAHVGAGRHSMRWNGSNEGLYIQTGTITHFVHSAAYFPHINIGCVNAYFTDAAWVPFFPPLHP